MSSVAEVPGPSRIKRKISDVSPEHDKIKHLAVEVDSEESNLLQCDRADSQKDSAARLGEYLSSQYEILRRALSNLSAIDLRKASQVCRAWRSAGRVVRDSRLQLHWLFWRAKSGGWNIPPPLAIYSAICEHVYSQPTLCIAFFTKTANPNFECSAPEVICPKTGLNKSCGLKHPLKLFMAAALSRQCKILSFPVSGVIGSSLDLKSTFEVELLRGRVQAMSAALFPNHPNVKVIHYQLSYTDLSKIREVNQQFDVAEMLNLPRDMLVQAVILICGSRVHDFTKSGFVAALQDRQEHRIAVGGGVTERAEGFEGIIFLGNGVCATSTVIPETVTEKDQLQEYINKMKICNLPDECSLGFMFSCLGRGKMWYDEANVESGAFNKAFPKTPIIGFFGRGEMGVNSLLGYTAQDSQMFWKDWNTRCNESKNSLPQSTKKVQRSNETSIAYTYSTCIVLLSFNTLSSNILPV